MAFVLTQEDKNAILAFVQEKNKDHKVGLFTAKGEKNTKDAQSIEQYLESLGNVTPEMTQQQKVNNLVKFGLLLDYVKHFKNIQTSGEIEKVMGQAGPVDEALKGVAGASYEDQIKGIKKRVLDNKDTERNISNLVLQLPEIKTLFNKTNQSETQKKELLSLIDKKGSLISEGITNVNPDSFYETLNSPLDPKDRPAKAFLEKMKQVAVEVTVNLEEPLSEVSYLLNQDLTDTQCKQIEEALDNKYPGIGVMFVKDPGKVSVNVLYAGNITQEDLSTVVDDALKPQEAIYSVPLKPQKQQEPVRRSSTTIALKTGEETSLFKIDKNENGPGSTPGPLRKKTSSGHLEQNPERTYTKEAIYVNLRRRDTLAGDDPSKLRVSLLAGETLEDAKALRDKYFISDENVLIVTSKIAGYVTFQVRQAGIYRNEVLNVLQNTFTTSPGKSLKNLAAEIPPSFEENCFKEPSKHLNNVNCKRGITQNAGQSHA